MKMGLFVQGVYVGWDQREYKTEDGTIKTTYYVFLNTGHEVQKFSTDKNLSQDFTLGDLCSAAVRVRAYEGKIYYYADNFERL